MRLRTFGAFIPGVLPDSLNLLIHGARCDMPTHCAERIDRIAVSHVQVTAIPL